MSVPCLTVMLLFCFKIFMCVYNLQITVGATADSPPAEYDTEEGNIFIFWGTHV